MSNYLSLSLHQVEHLYEYLPRCWVYKPTVNPGTSICLRSSHRIHLLKQAIIFTAANRGKYSLLFNKLGNMNTQKTAFLLIVCLALASAKEDPDDCGWSWKDYAYLGGGAIVAVVAAPVAIGAAGFTGAGIAAGSAAASLMSASATTGVGAGAIATLQAVGAAGLGYAGTIVTGAAGAAGGKIVKEVVDKITEKDEK